MLGAAAALGLALLWEGLRRLSPSAAEVESELATLLGHQGPIEIAGLALLSGFAEELFFRGGMLPSWGLALTTLAFGLLHTGPRAAYRPWTLFALLGGLVFGLLATLTGALLAPIVAHVAVNALGLWRLQRRPPD